MNVNHGASQSFTINPDASYNVADVLVDGSSVGAVTSYPFNNVTTNHTISASFVSNNVYTPTGINVSVDLGDGGRVIFSQVTGACNTWNTVSSSAPGPAPSEYRMLDTYYDITTCATYTGTITVTIPYDESLAGGSEGSVRLFHWESGAWRDVTVSVDTVNNTVTGQVSSLSPFGIGYPIGYSTGANTYMIALLALLAISTGVFLIRKHRQIQNI